MNHRLYDRVRFAYILAAALFIMMKKLDGGEEDNRTR